MSQIPLSLRIDEHASFTSFVAGGNNEAVRHVTAVASGARTEPVWLWGAEGSGRTHLLSAACRAAHESGEPAMYLDIAALPAADLLRGLENVGCVALDNIERAAGDRECEAALFAVLDARVAGNGRLLMASDRPPRECKFALADLASRAGAASVYRLEPLDDEHLTEAVTIHAGSRGLDLDAATAGYLLQRVSRNMVEVTAWLDRIDRFALARQRRVTPALIRQVIAETASA